MNKTRTHEESVGIFMEGCKLLRMNILSGQMQIPNDISLSVSDEINWLRAENKELKAQIARKESIETTTTASITHDAECGWVDYGRAWQDTGGVMHYPV